MKKFEQTKLESFIEVYLNTASGFILSYLAWLYLIPVLFKIETNYNQGFWVTIVFTIISVTRSYIWRRYFNMRIRKRIHKFLDNHNK